MKNFLKYENNLCVFKDKGRRLFNLNDLAFV